MRDYQTKANVGGGADSIVSTKFGAGEFNSIAQELENSVTRSGQTLANSSGTSEVFTQLAESLFLNAVKALSFADSGSANTYELTPTSGSSGVKVPASYANMDGAVLQFIPGNAATGASTLNIGQTSGTLLGTKALLNADGSAVASGDLPASITQVRYSAAADGGTGAWLIMPWTNQDFDVFVRSSLTTNLTVGYTNTAHDYGTITTGTVTVDFAEGAQAYYTNNGAHTLAAPASTEGAQVIYVTNGASAGAITTSSFTVDPGGDSLDTTEGNKFRLFVERINGTSYLFIRALQ
jgi:hypothetical protein